MQDVFKWLVVPATLAHAAAAPVIPPTQMFKDPAFVREFVGSYGILSDIEPKISAGEQEVLGVVRQMFEQAKFREAEAEIKRFIAETEHPKDRKVAPAEVSPAMIFVLGNLYFQADRTDEARRAFQEAIRRFPRFRRAYTNLAYLYISQNATVEALPMLQKSIELGENSARVYGLLGYCHLLKQNAIAAESAYRQASLLDPAARDWKLGLAQALMAQEKHPDAVNLLAGLIRDNPNDKQLWLQQTQALLATERKTEAAVNLEILHLKGLADENNLNLLGNLYMEQNQAQLALMAYQAALAKGGSFKLDRALKSARILCDYGFPAEAEKMLAQIRARMGKSAPAAEQVSLLLTQVRVQRAANHLDAVESTLDQLARLEPYNGEVLLEKARNYDMRARVATADEARSKLLQEAKTHYQLAVKMDAVAYHANLGLGQLLVREKQYIEAAPVLQKALELKKSESLDQYVSRVRRAAERQKKLNDDKAPTK